MVAALMALTVSTSTFPSSLFSPTSRKSAVSTSSFYAAPGPTSRKFCLSRGVSTLGLSVFSRWSGLKQLDISIRTRASRDRKRQRKGKGVYASLFGVGAPEVLVIGVVALLVFGPKGLAEVARNLGKTLRAFQPTIRELQDVSREFKSTLEREIGLDDINSSSRPNTSSTPSSFGGTGDSSAVVDPTDGAPPQKAYSSEDYLRITEEQLKASATQRQGQASFPGESKNGGQNQPQGSVEEIATVTPLPLRDKPESES